MRFLPTRRFLPALTKRSRPARRRCHAPAAQGKIVHSRDGLTWSDASISADDDFVDVAFGRGQFVAVGRHGPIYSSSTGDS